MKKETRSNWRIILCAAAAIISLLGASACQPEVKQDDKKEDKKFLPLPAGVFPQKLGRFVLNGEPKMDGSSNGESSYYSAVYSSNGKDLKCGVGVFSKPENPYHLLGDEEILTKSASLVIQFSPVRETIFVNTVAETARFSCSVDPEDVSEVANNLPFTEMKAVKPAGPINFALPASFNQLPKNKTEAEINKASQQLLLNMLKQTLDQNKLKVTEIRPNKIDKSTLMISIPGLLQTDASLAKIIKTQVGDSLKEVGFRQFVLNIYLEQL